LIKIKTKKNKKSKEKKLTNKNPNNNINKLAKILIENNSSEEKFENKNFPNQNFNFLLSENFFENEKDMEKEYNLSYNKNSFVKYYKFPIIPPQNKMENPIEESFDSHLICDLCVDIVNQEILNKVRLRSQKGKREIVRITEIKCILCLKEHHVEYKIFSKFVKSGFQRCCNIF
jgi:actin-related protein